MAKGTETPKLRLEADVVLASLVPNPRNPRRHLPAQLQKLAKSVKRFGQPRPILVRAENRMIIAGHGLTLAMQEAGATKGDVYWWDVPQDVADAYMLADNRTALDGVDNPDDIAILLLEVAKDNFGSLGFDDSEAMALLTGTEEPLVVHKIETTAVKDSFWISVRGDLKQQAKVLQKLRAVMADFPGVSVEMGTIGEA
jgi:hypothetical protein